jgi:UDP-glucose 4-epimerase
LQPLARRRGGAVTWLLTGGAGYIGAHVLRVLRDANLAVMVLDDLSTGVRSRVPPDVPLVEASVLDYQRVLATLREHNVRGVVHLAAKKAVGDSVDRPLYYFRENVSALSACSPRWARLAWIGLCSPPAPR